MNENPQEPAGVGEDVEAHVAVQLTRDALLSETYESGTIRPRHLPGAPGTDESASPTA